MTKMPKKCFVLALLLLFSSETRANQCLEILAPNSIRSSVSSSHSLSNFKELKSHPMWAHESSALQENLIRTFVDQSLEESADSLIQIIYDLKGSDKLKLLKEAESMIEAVYIDTAKFSLLSERLEKKFDIILDFGLDTSPRRRRFTFGSQVLVRDLNSLKNLIERVKRENLALLDLFELITKEGDSSIKSSRYVDSSTLNIKPFPEKITLLAYTIRFQYLDLFELLVHSPHIKGQLHLDYSVLLLDEIEQLSYDERSLFRPLAYLTFSSEAFEKYNKGLRGSDGTTMWDRIPITSY